MPRSAKDATRFTATAPYAYSKPVSSSARLSAPPPPPPQSGYSRTPQKSAAAPRDAAPPGETGAEKVARLRAAHAARREAEISTFDRVVVRGRAIADTAHRLTVAGIVGLSAICIGVVAYSFFDLHRHNKRKQEEWLANEFRMLQIRLREARNAEREGTASDDQILLLNRERAKAEAEADQKNRGVVNSVKGLFGADKLKSEEQVNDAALTGEAVADSIPVAPSMDASVPLAAPPRENTQKGIAPAAGPVMEAIQKSRRQGERALQASGSSGGALDQWADQAANKAKEDAKSWSSWLGLSSK